MFEANTPDGPPAESAPREWFRRSFDDFYVQLYAHRDDGEAATLVRTLQARFALNGPVLDVACGAGRLLGVLRRAGVATVGVDLSRPLLRRARVHFGTDLPSLARADMRGLPIRSGACAWTLLLFTSFGYFLRVEEDAEVLEELRRVLRPGGHMLLDFFNRPLVLRTLVSESHRQVAGREVHETRRVDPAGPFLRKRIEVESRGPDEPAAVYEEVVRLYSPEELIDLLGAAGFVLEAQWGGYDGAPFDPETSPRCLLIGRRSE